MITTQQHYNALEHEGNTTMSYKLTCTKTYDMAEIYPKVITRATLNAIKRMAHKLIYNEAEGQGVLDVQAARNAFDNSQAWDGKGILDLSFGTSRIVVANTKAVPSVDNEPAYMDAAIDALTDNMEG